MAIGKRRVIVSLLPRDNLPRLTMQRWIPSLRAEKGVGLQSMRDTGGIELQEAARKRWLQLRNVCRCGFLSQFFHFGPPRPPKCTLPLAWRRYSETFSNNGVSAAWSGGSWSTSKVGRSCFTTLSLSVQFELDYTPNHNKNYKINENFACVHTCVIYFFFKIQ